MKKAHFLLSVVAGVATIFGAGVAAAQDIYVSDMSDNSISVITPGPSGSVITLTSSLLDGPTGLAFDSSGNLFISNAGNGDIVEYNTSNGLFTNFESTGLANPRGLAFDSNGNLYVANDEPGGAGGGITQYQITGGIVTGTNSNYASPLNNPSFMAVDGANNIYATVAGDLIARVSAGGGAASTSSFGVPSLPLHNPNGIVFGPDGNLYIVNSGNAIPPSVPSTVEEVPLSLAGSFLMTAIGNVGQGLDDPQGLVFDSDGNLFVADFGNNTVTEYGLVPNSNGAYTLKGSYTSLDGIDGPIDVAVGPAGPAVPEPGTYALMLAGLGALYFYQRRRTLVPVKF